jgi:hypothetical protein
VHLNLSIFRFSSSNTVSYLIGQCGRWTVRQHDINPEYILKSARPSVHVEFEDTHFHYEPYRSTDVSLSEKARRSELARRERLAAMTPEGRKVDKIIRKELRKKLSDDEKKEQRRLETLERRREADDPYVQHELFALSSFLDVHLCTKLSVGARRMLINIRLVDGYQGELCRDLLDEKLPRRRGASYAYEFEVAVRDTQTRRRLAKSSESSTAASSSGLTKSDVSGSDSSASTRTLGAGSRSSIHTNRSYWPHSSSSTLGPSSESGFSSSSSYWSRKSARSWFYRGDRGASSSSVDDSSSEPGSNTSSNRTAGGPARGSRSQEWSRWRWPRRRRVTR